MLKSFQKADKNQNNIEEFQFLLNSESDFLNKQLVSQWLPQLQLDNKDLMISILNQYLLRDSQGRLDANKSMAIMQVIYFLCSGNAEIKITQEGTYYCSYCNGEFTAHELDVELFNKKAVDNAVLEQNIFTLNCGHTLHTHCFEELIKDFNMPNLVYKEEAPCECPGCDLYEGKISYETYIKFTQIKKPSQQQ